MYRLKNGKLAEAWTKFDRLGLNARARCEDCAQSPIAGRSDDLNVFEEGWWYLRPRTRLHHLAVRTQKRGSKH